MFQIYLKLPAIKIHLRTQGPSQRLLPLDNGSKHQMKALHATALPPPCLPSRFSSFPPGCLGAPVEFNCQAKVLSPSPKSNPSPSLESERT